MRLLEKNEQKLAEVKKETFLKSEAEMLREDVRSSLLTLNRNRDEADRIKRDALKLWEEKMSEIDSGKKELQRLRNGLVELARKRKLKLGKLDEEIVFSDLLTDSQKSIMAKRKELDERNAKLAERENEVKDLVASVTRKHLKVMGQVEYAAMQLRYLKERQEEINLRDRRSKEADEIRKNELDMERKELGKERTGIEIKLEEISDKEKELERREELIESRNATLRAAFQEAKLKGII
jgi:hypothetical protein